MTTASPMRPATSGAAGGRTSAVSVTVWPEILKEIGAKKHIYVLE